jgi:Zn-dependent protease/CBS domain-containing protein
MKWSWKLGTFSGIAVYVHATFALLLGAVLAAHVFVGRGLMSALTGVLFIVLIFLCVVLHEFGHALMAKRFGIETRDITLYPIGGVARLERIPRNPRQELLIAIAGPLVNVVIAASLALGLYISQGPLTVASVMQPSGDLILNLLATNVLLVVFNLLPAFPMDGGRVLRAVLAERMDYGRATHIAARIGQAMAFLFGYAGLYNPVMFFIAFFVYVGAQEEAAAVQAEIAFRGVPVREAMMSRFATLSPDDRLGRAVEQLLSGAQHDFPVVADGHMVGLLTRQALVSALGERGPESPIAAAMQPAPAPILPWDSLESTFQRMRESEVQTIPVERDGVLIGLVTLENIAEFLMLRNAVEGVGAGSLKNPAASEAAARPASEMSWRSWLYAPRRRARG